LFELGDATLNLTKLKYHNHQLTQLQFVQYLQSGIIPIFQESFRILKPEPEGSFEHKLTQAVQFYLETIEDFIKPQ
jgi:hypothetical protein